MSLGSTPPATPAPAPTPAAAPASENVFRRAYRALTADEQKLVDEVKDLGHALHSKLSTLSPSRELSLAKTKLEEAVMWAVKHLTG